ncbi:MAG: Sua5/YciO/YrdC/YwlC family protein, partial [Duncaniella sp.]|nr:Sua5/YciO/YrdC/YwlC family protein [Duncaniella sp.]
MTLEQDINNAVAALDKGGVILYPTDTVWGIGCDATDSAAVRRVFEIKRRADSKALITLVADVADIGRYSAVAPSVASAIIGASD